MPVHNSEHPLHSSPAPTHTLPLADHLAMITVQHPKYGLFDCKPLQVREAALPAVRWEESCHRPVLVGGTGLTHLFYFWLRRCSSFGPSSRMPTGHTTQSCAAPGRGGGGAGGWGAACAAARLEPRCSSQGWQAWQLMALFLVCLCAC